MTIQRNDIAKSILSSEQLALKSFLEEFSSTHILAGWTAIALQIGHRKSIDFDLFCFGSQGNGKELAKRIEKTWMKFDPKFSNLLWLSEEEQSDITIFIDWVKVQLIDFARNPFDISVSIKSNTILCKWIPSFNLLQLWALKAYAMMYRSKRKDAVDLYFIIQSWIKFEDIIKETKKIFTDLYKPEYTFETIFDNKRDMTETVEYTISNPPKDDEIINFLIDQAEIFLKKQIN